MHVLRPRNSVRFLARLGGGFWLLVPVEPGLGPSISRGICICIANGCPGTGKGLYVRGYWMRTLIFVRFTCYIQTEGTCATAAVPLAVREQGSGEMLDDKRKAELCFTCILKHAVRYLGLQPSG